MSAEHTPGPWAIGRAVSGEVCVGPECSVFHVCRVSYKSPTHNPKESEANAFLICAAPDLLAACERLLACRFTMDVVLDDVMALAEAAVRKAGRHVEEPPDE